jgi:hypothetical protein
MSDTRRAQSYGVFRHPKRNIQARDYEGVRVGAIPPTEYDDLQSSKEVYKVYRIVRRLLDRGEGEGEIERVILRRYKISGWELRRIVRMLSR